MSQEAEPARGGLWCSRAWVVHENAAAREIGLRRRILRRSVTAGAAM